MFESNLSFTKIITARRDRARQYANPVKMAQNLWAQRELIGQFTKREVQSRYKGSSLELGWQPQHSDLEKIVGDAWKWFQRHPEGMGRKQ